MVTVVCGCLRLAGDPGRCCSGNRKRTEEPRGICPKGQTHIPTRASQSAATQPTMVICSHTPFTKFNEKC